MDVWSPTANAYDKHCTTNAYDRLQAGCLRHPFEGYNLYKPFHIKNQTHISSIKSSKVTITETLTESGAGMYFSISRRYSPAGWWAVEVVARESLAA